MARPRWRTPSAPVRRATQGSPRNPTWCAGSWSAPTASGCPTSSWPRCRRPTRAAARRSSSEAPVDAHARVGLVHAEVACPHRGREVLAERRTAGGDLLHHRADRPAHVDARALGCRSGGAAAPAEPDRTRELVGEEVDLLLRARRALDVAPPLRLLELVAQVSQPALVRGAGCGIEQVTGVAPGLTAGTLDQRLAATREVQHVKLAARVLEQHLEEAEALRILQLEAVGAEGDRPEIDLAAEGRLHGHRARRDLGRRRLGR